MTNDDFKNRTAQQAAREFNARRAALHADFAAHEQNQDEVSASQTLQELAKLDLEEQAAASLYQRHQDAQRPVYDVASPEQRQARQPNEMTSQDMADMMNGSRHRGRGFTADDYNRLRSGLGWYKSARGVEQK
jgi:hypothetical protein